MFMLHLHMLAFFAPKGSRVCAHIHVIVCVCVRMGLFLSVLLLNDLSYLTVTT